MDSVGAIVNTLHSDTIPSHGRERTLQRFRGSIRRVITMARDYPREINLKGGKKYVLAHTFRGWLVAYTLHGQLHCHEVESW